MTQPNAPLTEGDLAQFIGSETLYQHPGFNVRYTEGVRYVAEHGGAFWLIDAIAPGKVTRASEMIRCSRASSSGH